MSFWRTLTGGLRTLLRRDEFEGELSDEVTHFIELSAQRHMQRGLSRAEAMRQARAEVGGIELVKEQARSGGWEFTMDGLLRDIRYGTRSLLRNPAFTLAAILTLAIGIGGNTIVFSMVNAVLLRPPPHVRAPEEMVQLFTSDFSGPPYGTSSYPDFEEFRKQTSLFSGLAAVAFRPVGVGEGDDLQNDGVELVSADYFQVLGVAPSLGRFFVPEEGKVSAPTAVAILSHRLWRQRFGGDGSVVGKSTRLNGRVFTIIGVAPAGYAGTIRGLDIGVWVPITAGELIGAPREELTNRGNRSFFVVGRLAPGATVARASAAMATVARNLAATYPDWWLDVTKQGRRVTVLPERETRVPPQVAGPVLGFVGLLMGTLLLVLLVCCANVAGLMLARSTRRAHEMGIRLSLGASRGRVARQLLTESVLVAGGGALAGTLLAWVAIRMIMAFEPPLPVRVALDLRLDGRVFLFTLTVAALTGVIFGMAPALRASRQQVTGMLKGDATMATVRGRRVSLQAMLVAGQMAMSVLLLVGALLFLRSLRTATSIDPGFATTGTLLFDASPRPDRAASSSTSRFGEQMQRQLSALAGVKGVSWGSSTPLGLDGSRRGVTIDGYAARDGEDLEFYFNTVGPSYFETMQIPLRAGRGITELDRRGSPGVVVVSEAFARRFWPGQSALGKRLSAHGPEGPWLEVVGVARDAKYFNLTEEALPYLYYASLQQDDRDDSGGMVVYVRANIAPLSLKDAVRREVAQVAPDWQVTSIRSMEQQLGVSLAPQRVASTVLSLFGVVALLLAAVGLYGVVAFAVASRRREIGVRLALGARRHDVVGLMVRTGLRLALWGLAIGLPVAWAVSRLLTSFLIGADAANVWTFVVAGALLAAVAILAAWLPARRAAAVHPMNALRTD
ncbi:MAG: ABC transporter permease [Gemmatimonadaceae bacterium]